MSEEIARFVVTEAVWAPSVHNTQPWRFVADGQQISLYADVDRGLPVADPDGREMMISCGAALFNARLALRRLGYIPETRVLPDPGQPALVARVSWRRRAPVGEFERRLADQVHLRRSHRGAFDPEPVPRDLLVALCGCAAKDGAALRIVADDGQRAALAATVQTAEQHLQLDAERVRELARWSPAPGSARRDGVLVSSYPGRAERTDPYFPCRDFSYGHGWGMQPLSTARLPRVAGAVGLLTTATDRKENWVSAGQALQRMLLTASTCGVAVALHSQPIELPWLREFIRTQLSGGAYPHLVLRIGMAVQAAASTRRGVDDVLFPSGGGVRSWEPRSPGTGSASATTPGSGNGSSRTCRNSGGCCSGPASEQGRSPSAPSSN